MLDPENTAMGKNRRFRDVRGGIPAGARTPSVKPVWARVGLLLALEVERMAFRVYIL